VLVRAAAQPGVVEEALFQRSDLLTRSRLPDSDGARPLGEASGFADADKQSHANAAKTKTR
jgi:hypothetical protein